MYSADLGCVIAVSVFGLLARVGTFVGHDYAVEIGDLDNQHAFEKVNGEIGYKPGSR